MALAQAGNQLAGLPPAVRVAGSALSQSADETQTAMLRMLSDFKITNDQVYK